MGLTLGGYHVLRKLVSEVSPVRVVIPKSPTKPGIVCLLWDPDLIKTFHFALFPCHDLFFMDPMKHSFSSWI